MATIAVRLFAEPDQFAAAIRPAHSQCTITRRGKYSAELTLVDLENVRYYVAKSTPPMRGVGPISENAGRS